MVLGGHIVPDTLATIRSSIWNNQQMIKKWKCQTDRSMQEKLECAEFHNYDSVNGKLK